MLSDPVVLALIGGVIAILTLASPMLTTWLVRRGNSADRKAQWDREDAVALAAKNAAERTASLIAEGNQANSEATRVTVGKLDVIHTLVNSTLTAAMQVALDGVRRELALMERDPQSDPTLIEGTKIKIGELERIIDARNQQTAIANLQSQQEEAAKVSAAVGVVTSKPSPMPTLGEVTQRVLRGEPAPVPVTSSAPMTETQKTAQANAAAATVDAASDTVKAAAKTVETMKKA